MAHFDLEQQDTICAPATAPAPAAIAIVRVSGRHADAVLSKVFRRRHRAGELPPPMRVTLGDVITHEGAEIDEALCTRFETGRSYTGEASFELSIHGGPTRVASTMAALLHAGCRVAEPGEFTLRAVLGGRMDLCAAEAVHDVVNARTDAAARVALRALHGGLSDTTAPVRSAIVDALAEIEARMDYPDEDLGDASREQIREQIVAAASTLGHLLDTASRGRRLIEGARIVLYGRPNAGKSTLLNALVGQDRALVHASPGTTRDVLEAETSIGGIPCTLVDVAGVREEGAGEVEALGIERARAELHRANVIIRLVAADDGLPTLELPQLLEAPVLDVVSKADLATVAASASKNEDASAETIAVSALTRAGLVGLTRSLEEALGAGAAIDDGALLTRVRQQREVADAKGALEDAAGALAASAPDEIVASELRRAGKALDRLLGQVLKNDLGEDVLDAVFSRFCIGK